MALEREESRLEIEEELLLEELSLSDELDEDVLVDDEELTESKYAEADDELTLVILMSGVGWTFWERGLRGFVKTRSCR